MPDHGHSIIIVKKVFEPVRMKKFTEQYLTFSLLSSAVDIYG